MRNISLAIPTFNRIGLLLESFEKVYDDERIAEIVIVDDCSNDDVWERVMEKCFHLPKVKLYRNQENLDCYYNKFTSISHATKKWVILLDSDNKIDTAYIDRIFEIEDWQPFTAYLPSFAAPCFDYRKYERLEVTSHNVEAYMGDATFQTCLNTANYFVNREFYMKCWDGETNPHTSDSIYMNYLYLKNGGSLYIVPNLTYEHRVDNHGTEQQGHYVSNCHLTGSFHEEVQQKLRELR